MTAKTAPTKDDRRVTPLQSILLRLWQNPNARLGGMLAAVMVTIAILVPVLDAGYDATRDRNLRARYAEPDCLIGWGVGTLEGEWSCDHPFGADKLGRDIFRRVGHGMSTSLRVGVFVVIIATSIGSLVGLLAGFLGGWFESISMRLMDILLAFPALLLAIALVSMRGAGLMNAMYAIAITQIPIFARLARSMALSLRSSEYVLAARSLGASDWRLLTAHIFPNSLAPAHRPVHTAARHRSGGDGGARFPRPWPATADARAGQDARREPAIAPIWQMVGDVLPRHHDHHDRPGFQPAG